MKMAMNPSSVHPLEIADDPDKDEYFYSIKKRIYQSAKEGFSLNLQVLISRVDNPEIRNVLVNQVRNPQLDRFLVLWKIEKRRNGKFSQSSQENAEFLTKFSPAITKISI